MKKTQSISFRLIIGGLLVVLLPLSVTGWLSTRNSSRALEDISHGMLLGKAANTAEIISRVVTAQKNLGRTMAGDPLVRKTALTVDRQGVENAGEEIGALMQRLAERYEPIRQDYVGIFLADATGYVYMGVMEGGKEYKGFDVGKTEYFRHVKETGEVMVSDVLKSRLLDSFLVSLIVPLYDENKKFLGVLGMPLRFSVLQDIILGQKFGESGYAFMTNKNGILQMHPNVDLILKTDMKKLAGMEELTKQILSGKSGVQGYIFNGVDKLAGYAPVVGSSWSVAVVLNEDEFLASAHQLRDTTIIITLVSMLVVGVVVFFAARALTVPINKAVAGLKDIAEGEGDLTMRLNTSARNELGELATWFNIFIEKIQKIIRQIGDSTEDTDMASRQLAEISTVLNSHARDASDRANSVAAATEELNSNISGVAAAMEQSSTNISMVASAAEEMTATIVEIAGNVKTAASISKEAVEQAEDTSEKMAELEAAAQAISKVTEVITAISDQTNLLALNATIEAARAGEAGKGFAVVANEIKELAKQTAEATSDIRNQIDGVQRTSTSSIDAIGRILQIINRINEIIETVSTAVNEQSTATQEIAGNISQASQGLSEVNENINQASVVSGSISGDVAEVNVASSQIAENSANIATASGDLQGLAAELKHIVSTFKI